MPRLSLSELGSSQPLELEHLEDRLVMSGNPIVAQVREMTWNTMAADTGSGNLYRSDTDGTWIVGAYQNGTVEVRSAATGAVARTMQTGVGRAYAVTVDNGIAYVSAGTNAGGCVIAWDCATGEKLWQKNLGNNANAIGVQDGVIGVDVDYKGTMQIDAASGNVLAGGDPEGYYGTVVRKGVVVYARAGNQVWLDEAGSRRMLASGGGNITARIAVSPDGQFIAVGRSNGGVELRSADGWNVVGTAGVNGAVSSIGWSVTGNTLLVGSASGEVTQWTVGDDGTLTEAGRTDTGRMVFAVDEVNGAVFAQVGDSGAVWRELPLWEARVAEESAISEAASDAVFAEMADNEIEENDVMSTLALVHDAPLNAEALATLDTQRQEQILASLERDRRSAGAGYALVAQAIADIQAGMPGLQATLQEMTEGYAATAGNWRSTGEEIRNALNAMNRAQEAIDDANANIDFYEAILAGMRKSFVAKERIDPAAAMRVVGVTGNHLVVETAAAGSVRVSLRYRNVDGVRDYGWVEYAPQNLPNGFGTIVFTADMPTSTYDVLLNVDGQNVPEQTLCVVWNRETRTVTLTAKSFMPFGGVTGDEERMPSDDELAFWRQDAEETLAIVHREALPRSETNGDIQNALYEMMVDTSCWGNCTEDIMTKLRSCFPDAFPEDGQAWAEAQHLASSEYADKRTPIGSLLDTLHAKQSQLRASAQEGLGAYRTMLGKLLLGAIDAAERIYSGDAPREVREWYSGYWKAVTDDTKLNEARFVIVDMCYGLPSIDAVYAEGKHLWECQEQILCQVARDTLNAREQRDILREGASSEGAREEREKYLSSTTAAQRLLNAQAGYLLASGQATTAIDALFAAKDLYTSSGTLTASALREMEDTVVAAVDIPKELISYIELISANEQYNPYLVSMMGELLSGQGSLLNIPSAEMQGQLLYGVVDAGLPTDEPVDAEQMMNKLKFDANGPGEYVAGIFTAPSSFQLLLTDLKNEAAIITQKNFPDETNFHNNLPDAFRHAYVAFRITQIVGGNNAKAILDGHEISVPNEMGERLMDLYNNNVGRMLFQKYGNSTADAAEIIWEAIAAGLLQIKPFTLK